MKKIFIAACLSAALISGMLSACNTAKKIGEAAKTIKDTYNKHYGSSAKAEKDESVYSDIFKNKDFLNAVAECFGKDAKDLTEKDILSVEYISLGYDIMGVNKLQIGFSNFFDIYFSEEYQTEEERNEALLGVIKEATLTESDSPDYTDLALFKNIRAFEIIDTPISDISFVKSFENLESGHFQNNGITDISPLSDYRPESLESLDFTGNEIQDWTPVEDIADKVIVNYIHTEDGDYVTMLEDVLMRESSVTVPSVDAVTVPEQDTGSDSTDDISDDSDNIGDGEILGEVSSDDVTADGNEVLVDGNETETDDTNETPITQFVPDNEIDWGILFEE